MGDQIESDSDLDVLVHLLEDNDSELRNQSFGSSFDNELNSNDCYPSKKINNIVNDKANCPGASGQSTEVVMPDVNEMENELMLMEMKMKKLKEEIVKKKNMKDGVDSVNFTKISSVIDPKCLALESKVRTLNHEEKNKLFKDLNSKKSEIHTGDTDSEDDEDNRTPFESHLSTSGREMKKRMAHSSQTFNHLNKKNEGRGWKGSKGTSLVALGKSNSKSEDKDQACTVDPFSGIRIIKPLVSCSTMKEMMGDRRSIPLSAVASHARGGEIEGDWVTIGIIVSKSETKTSQKGTSYCIWQMSDLRDCTKIVSLFLFASAYKTLWKTIVGSVVGILNPQIMKDSNKQTDGRNVLTLSINTNEKILMMGTSKDLGWCKGRNKEGSNCRQFVNKNVCEFCVFHIQREYQKMSSKRAVIQSSFTRVDPRKSFQNKVLGKNEVFYGGQLFSSGGSRQERPVKNLSKANKSKDLNTLSSLTTKLKADDLKERDQKDSFLIKHLSDNQLTTVKTVAKQNEALGQLLLTSSPGARNLLRHNTKENQVCESPQTKPQNQLTSAREFLKNVAPSLKGTACNKAASPQFGRGLKPGQSFDLEISSTRLDPVKARAASVVKRLGGIQAPEKNMKKNKDKAMSSEFQDKVRKRIRDVSVDRDGSSPTQKMCKTEETQSALDIRSKASSLLGSVDINSEKFLSVMNAKSNHTNLIQTEEDEQLERYYNTLEKKEMLENKMAAVKEVPVTAVVCLKCKYKAVSANPHCKEESHPLKTVKAVKRFFECAKCKQRTISLDKLPGKPCSHCSETSWKRVSMAKEKKGPKLESEILSLRGDELSQISSSSKDIYLNL